MLYLVVIGWLYVALMMAAAEAMSPTGTLLGAIVTFLLYGLGPVALIVYLLTTPQRRARRRKAAADRPDPPPNPEPAASEPLPTAGDPPDAGRHPAGAAVASIGEPPLGRGDGAPGR